MTLFKGDASSVLGLLCYRPSDEYPENRGKNTIKVNRALFKFYRIVERSIINIPNTFVYDC